jgi:hypothetical protein
VALALAVATLGLAPAGGSAAPKTTCTSGDDGIVLTREATVRLRRKPAIRVVERRTLDRFTAAETVVSTLTRGSKTVFETEVARAASAVTIAYRFGFGFTGIGEIRLRLAGGAVEMSVDGRAVRVEGGAEAPVVVFEDGQAPPELRAKRKIARLLRKFQKRPPVACPAAATAASDPAVVAADTLNDPFENECETCWSVCFLKGDACFAGKIAACALSPLGCGVAFVVEFFQSSFSCGDGIVQCGNNCNAKGNECCRSFCGDACCSHAFGRSDWVCAGARPGDAGQCCFPEDVCGPSCCGARVVDGTVRTAVCADETSGLCCVGDATVCAGTCCPAPLECKPNPPQPGRFVCTGGDPCGAFSCPDGQRCQFASDDFDEVQCIPCAADAGPVCGDVCCAADEVCGFGNTCCTADKLCGGTCCSSPANCLNGTTCCEPPSGAICGGNCCPPLGDCCNGQCCAGVCVAGAICCAPDRECGSQCCALNQTCQSGSCVACGCPEGQECCPGGTAACCTPPSICCQPEGQPKGCYAVNDCLGLG